MQYYMHYIRVDPKYRDLQVVIMTRISHIMVFHMVLIHDDVMIQDGAKVIPKMFNIRGPAALLRFLVRLCHTIQVLVVHLGYTYVTSTP